MPGLTLSNEFISRDEALHTEFAVLLYSKLGAPLAGRPYSYHCARGSGHRDGVYLQGSSMSSDRNERGPHVQIHSVRGG